jgi:hypothetical protein
VAAFLPSVKRVPSYSFDKQVLSPESGEDATFAPWRNLKQLLEKQLQRLGKIDKHRLLANGGCPRCIFYLFVIIAGLGLLILIVFVIFTLVIWCLSVVCPDGVPSPLLKSTFQYLGFPRGYMV